MNKSITVCSKCILDENIPNIAFDEQGICNYCRLHEKRERLFPTGDKGRKILDEIFTRIKKDGKGKEYDCIAGISGGTDSSYVLHLLKEYGLRILAVHFDNGWNSELAVNNIKQLLNKLQIELYTYVVDWEEFKELQKVFLRASVPDVEKVTDNAVSETVYMIANKYNIKYIIGGGNFRTEGEIPRGWTYMDEKYFKSVIRQHSEIKKFQTYPFHTILKKQYYSKIKKINMLEILDYIDYDKQAVIRMLESKYGWKNYGGKHYESIFTRWFQSYYLPEKFNIDKRKVHLSALINSGQLTREMALEEMKKETYPSSLIEKDTEYIKKKLEFSDDEFNAIITAPPKSFLDYKSYYPLFRALRPIYKKLSKNFIRRP